MEDSTKLQKVIGVRFKKAGKIHLFDPGNENFERGDYVVVDTTRGLECGEVAIGVREIPVAENPGTPAPRKIYRKATKADIARLEENRAREQRAYDICKRKIVEHGLPMNLIDVSYSFDFSKIVFYFTAEGRVDFRELVKDLAYIFRTRIDLRQVGVRDEAKKLGGVGCCGRPLCCANFLGDFAQVSIRMAKEQNLSLNPAKISGICGRLLCCLKFESDYYHENYVEQVHSYQPRPGDRVVVEDGVRGKIVAVNVVRRNATILLDDDKTLVSGWEDLVPLDSEEPDKKAKENAPAEIKEPPPVERERERPRKTQPKTPPRQENSRTTNLFDNRQPKSDKPAKTSKHAQRKSSKKSKRDSRR